MPTHDIIDNRSKIENHPVKKAVTSDKWRVTRNRVRGPKSEVQNRKSKIQNLKSKMARWPDDPIPLLSHAKGFEDDIEDVVDVGGAGDEVEGTQSVVEIEQEHFVVRVLLGGLAGLGQTLE